MLVIWISNDPPLVIYSLRLVDLFSILQSIVALYTAEAEYMTVTETFKKVMDALFY